VVHRLGEAASGFLLAILIKHVDLDGPLLHGEALINGRLVAVGLDQPPSSMFRLPPPSGSPIGCRSLTCCAAR
jgi:hypothetical protein